MWIKLDDGFATHPKIMNAGLEAMAIQVRAICYASQHKTDGFIPVQAVCLFVSDVTPRPEGWATYMVGCGLWELRENGYEVHDYLDWNMSKDAYLEMKLKLSKAGKKGMKSRWKRGNPRYKVGNSLSDNPTDNPPYNKTITQQSTSTDTLSSLSVSESGPNLQSIPQTKTKRHGLCEFPPDFVMSDDMKARASALDLNPHIEFAKFKDHHLSKGSKFKDWQAAWRTWVRNGVEMKEARQR